MERNRVPKCEAFGSMSLISCKARYHPTISDKTSKTPVFTGVFIFSSPNFPRILHDYTILFRIFRARSSSRGYRCEYVFQVISILEWPKRRATSWMFIPSFASRIVNADLFNTGEFCIDLVEIMILELLLSPQRKNVVLL